MIVGLFFAAAVVAISRASDVVILTSDNFEHQTQAATGSTTGDWLVKFYAPWCGHCKKMEPTWDELATSLKGKVNVAKVDVTANRELGSRFDIKGFPTVKFFSKGKIYEYKGARTVDAFTKFVQEGYKSTTPGEVPKPPSFTEQVQKVLKEIVSGVRRDISKGNYFSQQVLMFALPIIFLLLIVVSTVLISSGASERPAKKASASEPAAAPAPKDSDSKKTD